MNNIEGTSPEDNPDCIELNTGVNNKVEDARSLASQLEFLPTRNYRVFILDEAHLFTRQAASTLLKHIEEPPAKLIFILVTNEPEKLLATIRGRCLEIALNRPTPQALQKILKRIIKKEKADKFVNDKILKKVAEYSDGKPRDSIQLLQGVVNLVAGGYDPKKALKESLASTRLLDQVAIKFLLGAYLGNASVMIKAMRDTTEHVSLLNVMLEIHEMIPQTLAGAQTLYTNPARRELLKILKDRVKKKLTLERSLIVHDKLVTAKLNAATFLAKEKDTLYQLIHTLDSK